MVYSIAKRDQDAAAVKQNSDRIKNDAEARVALMALQSDSDLSRNILPAKPALAAVEPVSARVESANISERPGLASPDEGAADKWAVDKGASDKGTSVVSLPVAELVKVSIDALGTVGRLEQVMAVAGGKCPAERPAILDCYHAVPTIAIFSVIGRGKVDIGPVLWMSSMWQSRKTAFRILLRQHSSRWRIRAWSRCHWKWSAVETLSWQRLPPGYKNSFR